MATELFRRRYEAIDAILEGIYKFVPQATAAVEDPILGKGFWLLIRWRWISRHNGHISVGTWYKIHKNKKKDMGVMKLRRHCRPTVEQNVGDLLTPAQLQEVEEYVTSLDDVPVPSPESNAAGMLRAVWNDPYDRITIAVCADALVEDLNLSYDDAETHARHHAYRAQAFAGGNIK